MTDDLSKRIARLELSMAEHLATCAERNKSVDAKLDNIGSAVTDVRSDVKEFRTELKEAREMPPQSLGEGVWRFVNKNGIAGAVLILLALVLWWTLPDRAARQETLQKLEKIEKSIEDN